jgi:hypothetical protein
MYRRFRDARHLSGAIECPWRGSFAQTIGSSGVLREKPRVGKPFLEQIAMQGECNRDVSAWSGREMKVRLVRDRCRSRIDHDKPRAGFLRLAYVRDEMNARRRRIDAPQNDQLRMQVVLLRV